MRSASIFQEIGFVCLKGFYFRQLIENRKVKPVLLNDPSDVKSQTVDTGSHGCFHPSPILHRIVQLHLHLQKISLLQHPHLHLETNLPQTIPIELDSSLSHFKILQRTVNCQEIHGDVQTDILPDKIQLKPPRPGS